MSVFVFLWKKILVQRHALSDSYVTTHSCSSTTRAFHSWMPFTNMWKVTNLTQAICLLKSSQTAGKKKFQSKSSALKLLWIFCVSDVMLQCKKINEDAEKAIRNAKEALWNPWLHCVIIGFAAASVCERRPKLPCMDRCYCYDLFLLDKARRNEGYLLLKESKSCPGVVTGANCTFCTVFR